MRAEWKFDFIAGETSAIDALFGDSLGPEAKVGGLALYKYPKNGYAHHQGHAQEAGLVVGQAYRITAVVDRGYSTDLWLEGHERPFNSCMFAEFPD